MQCDCYSIPGSRQSSVVCDCHINPNERCLRHDFPNMLESTQWLCFTRCCLTSGLAADYAPYIQQGSENIPPVVDFNRASWTKIAEEHR
jgi:hypothetical protein